MGDEVKIDEQRYAEYMEHAKPNTTSEAMQTGIYVRAQRASGSWESADISTLDRNSLLEWLRSRGGNNVWAENVVGILLGHGHLHGGEGPVVVRGGDE